MKLQLFLTGLLIYGTMSAQLPRGTQVASGQEVPVIVTEKFASQYTDVNPVWWVDKENSQYSAQFTHQPSGMGGLLIYDSYGNVLRTDKQVDDKNYPPEIKTYCTRKYPNESFQVWSSEDQNGNKSFYSVHTGGTDWFDKRGNYKEKTPKGKKIKNKSTSKN
jgi:hypothetical protein